METVIVIGGGASGLVAALTAAEDKSRRVILFERQQRVGRKLLSTGNGRCNLTNTDLRAEHYHGEQAEFALPALSKFSSRDALDFFSALGLLTVTEYGGRVYPLSNSANSVLDVLRFALDRAGVEQRCSCPVRELRREGSGYTVVTDEGETRADYVIVACGGAAGAKLGGVMDGYKLMEPLGHRRTTIFPALVQLTCESDYPRSLKGVRAEVRLRLLREKALLKESEGELQFTEKGVSGPAVFDISRTASVTGTGLTLSIDFLRDYSMGDVLSLLNSRAESFPALPCSELFTGMLHNRLGRMLIKYALIDQTAPLSSLTSAALTRAAEAGKSFTLPVRGTEGFDQAQVTAGGLRTAAFDPETLESRSMPGLFACGELLDIDGDCGGYNLQWAWASGRLAGRLGR